MRFLLIVSFFVLFFSMTYSQNEGREKSMHFDRGEVTTGHVREMPSEKREVGGERPGNQGGGHGNENAQTSGTSTAIKISPNVNPYKAPSTPITASPTTIKYLKVWGMLNNTVTAIKTFIGLNPIVALFTDNPREVLAAIALQISQKDYQEFAEACKNLGEFQKEQLNQIAISATLELKDEFNKSNSTKETNESLKQEEKFWDNVIEATNKSMIAPLPLTSIPVVSVGGRLTLDISYAVFSVSANRIITGFKFVPSQLLIYNGVNKDLVFRAEIEYSQDPTFEGWGVEGMVYNNIRDGYFSPTTNKEYTMKDGFIFIPMSDLEMQPNKKYYIKGKIWVYYYDRVLKQSPWVQTTYSPGTSFGVH